MCHLSQGGLCCLDTQGSQGSLLCHFLVDRLHPFHPSASLEIRVRLAPLDLKDTEVMRVLQALRVSEELQDPLDPLETRD